MRPTRPTRLPAVPAALVAALLLTGCSGGLGQRAGDPPGGQTGYVSGDGSVTQLPPGERPEPVTIAGRATDGSPVDVAALRGDVVVLNYWYAACGPCRAEADDLGEAARAGEADGVRFVGVNVRDDAAGAAAFERTFDVPYPSVLDAGSGEGVLAVSGLVSPQSIPATIVLDRAGRPAARVLGPVDPAVLDDLIADAVAEAAA